MSSWHNIVHIPILQLLSCWQFLVCTWVYVHESMYLSVYVNQWQKYIGNNNRWYGTSVGTLMEGSQSSILTHPIMSGYATWWCTIVISIKVTSYIVSVINILCTCTHVLYACCVSAASARATFCIRAYPYQSPRARRMQTLSARNSSLTLRWQCVL